MAWKLERGGQFPGGGLEQRSDEGGGVSERRQGQLLRDDAMRGLRARG